MIYITHAVGTLRQRIEIQASLNYINLNKNHKREIAISAYND